ncbi:MAG: MarR family transcriptional regulator [Gemmatimonadaceae bacterium]|jgi:MarR family 2-MHQ and catechol resistance regulon transcriptional repressor|nr:MarR family transcriptional regulator [Gemmatimonadaceae bacterium]
MTSEAEIHSPAHQLTGPDAPAPPPQDVPTATALKLWVVLARANAAIEAHARADIERHGLSPAEFGVLEALHHKGPLLLGDVQRRTLISSGGTTFLIDRLEKKGLVERRLCASDRRARYAALTAQGRALMTEVFPAHAEVIRRAMAGLGLADQRAITDLLRVLGQEAAALSLPV